MLTYDGNAHQAKCLNPKEDDEGTEAEEALTTEAVYMFLRSECQSLVLMPIPEVLVLCTVYNPRCFGHT